MHHRPGVDAPAIAEDLATAFRMRYGVPPRVFRAPGRVNLIGEHTDYNDGYVMPAAIEFYVWVAIAPRTDRLLVVHSQDFNETIEIDLDDPAPRRKGRWADYIQGVAVVLEEPRRRLSGANLLVHGKVPIGAGLSSSAAIGTATGFALLENSGFGVDRVELAQVCRRAENEFVGARVGIMDPFVSCSGHAGQALMIDCRSLQFRLVPVPPDVSLVICNTMVKHEHASGGYNARRRDCDEAVRLLSRQLPHVKALRDVHAAELPACSAILPSTIYRRCKHVVEENARVLAGATALANGDLIGFGRCMAESHVSLRDDFEVSCDELDLMVRLANQVEGVYGARMTGGGFGGCTVNLVDKSAVAAFTVHVTAGYKAATGRAPQVFVSPAAEGASEVRP